jgi:flagellar motor switch protein FliN/FliY
MAESIKQDEADALIKQVQESNEALASDTQALDQAAQIATDIAGEIQHTQSPPGTPTEAAPGAAPAAPPATAPLADSASLAAADTAPPYAAASAPVYSSEIQRLLAIEVPVIVQLGIRRMNVGEVMHFAVGAIIEFSKSAEEELELLANNKDIGKGYAVKVGENFGIKLTHIGPVKETIRKLGAA